MYNMKIMDEISILKKYMLDAQQWLEFPVTYKGYADIPIPGTADKSKAEAIVKRNLSSIALNGKVISSQKVDIAPWVTKKPGQVVYRVEFEGVYWELGKYDSAVVRAEAMGATRHRISGLGRNYHSAYLRCGNPRPKR